MTSKVAANALGMLILGLALGLPGAGAHSLATTTLKVQVIGLGTVVDNLGNINCGNGSTNCYHEYVSGTSVTLIQTAAAAWTFSGWSGDCTGTVCALSLDGSEHEAIAEFTTSPTPGTSTLTVAVTGDAAEKGGNVEGGDIDCDPPDTSCTWDVVTGSTVTLVETPESGFSFSGWGGACTGAARRCTVSLGVDQSVNATFAPSAASFTLSVAVTGNGTVSGGGISCTSAGVSGCTQSQSANASVTLTATPASGAGFTGWGGACAGASTTCTLTMDAAKSVTAAFTGAGGGGGTGSTFALTVTVTGSGTVSGNGIDCGSGATACSVNITANTSATLTAAAGSGSSFSTWGGACSGTGGTCTLTMNAAKSVTATFTGETGAATALLTLKVVGRGTVSGPGGACASTGPPRTCSQPYGRGRSIDLAAAPVPGGRFLRWSGACTGTNTACTLTLAAPATVTASFAGAPASGPALSARGRPLVREARGGFEVTLRFQAGRPGFARVRALRAGRVETGLGFTAGAGRGTVGPLFVRKPGYYTFELRQGGRTISWRTCLGRCGKAAPGGPFTVVRRSPTIVRAGEAWSVTLRFRSNRPAGAVLRILRGGRLVRAVQSAPPAGENRAGPYVLTPGTYTLRLTLTDAYGRTWRLTWVALLPR